MGDSAGDVVDTPTRLSISNEVWRASVESLDLGDGLRIFLTDVDARADASMEPSHEESQPWFAVNVLLKGQSRLVFADGRATTVDTARTVMFHPADQRARYRVDAGQQIRIAGLRINRERLERVLGGHIPASLQHLLEPRHEETRMLGLRTTGQIRRAAQSIFSTSLTGALRTAYLEGVVLQLLALQIAATDADLADAAGASINPLVRRKVQEARERLLSDLRDPPSLHEMAAAAGMSEKALNAGFRNQFGATVFETLRNERLEHARVVLEREDMPLKLLAARVGYRHVNNFITAFTARFGAAPRQYLRDRSTNR